jgi:PAT family beta-lactamase induction signal transducer AmpG
MLVTQICLLISTVVVGRWRPESQVQVIIVAAAIVAFFSATQDIVLDAYRRELLPDLELGIGNAVHIQTYRIAGLVPGSLAFVLADHMPWSVVITTSAAGRPSVSWTSTGMPRPSSVTVTLLSSWMTTEISLQ